MRELNSDRVHTEYRDGVSETFPLVGRKYTITHSDETAEVFVTIGKEFASDKFGALRDEVILMLTQREGKIQMYGTVIVNSEEIPNGAKYRNDIFLRELPGALEALRFADRDFYNQYEMLDELPIYIWFQSTFDEFNKVYDYGKMKDYKQDAT